MQDDLRIYDPRVGRVLAAARALRGREQNDVARKAGLRSGVALCLIEKGKRHPTLWELGRIVTALDTADAPELKPSR